MAGITPAQAETELASALTALQNARTAQSYQHGNRSKANHDLRALQDNVSYWNKMTLRLSRGGVSVSRVRLHG